MIHYHGTPITPRAELLTMMGRHFCVSYAAPRDADACQRIGASVLFDNGAFPAWTAGCAVSDWSGFYEWVSPRLSHPHWCIVPDVIGGTAEENDALLSACPLSPDVAAPVWHTDEPLDRLRRLADRCWRICIGSSRPHHPGSEAWRRRIDEAWDALEHSGARPWVHMLRAMREASLGEWPFASADSTAIARNHNGSHRDPAVPAEVMARRLDGRNPRFHGKRASQGVLL
jgi:hypothetical protein